MDIRLLVIIFWVWVGLSCGYADSWKNAKDLLEITSRVPLADDERMELNRRTFTKAAVRYGKADLVDDVLAAGSHYNTAQSYVETILSGWPICNREMLYGWTSNAITKLPFAMGYQIYEEHTRLLKITLVGDFFDLEKKVKAINYPNRSQLLTKDMQKFEAILRPSIIDWFRHFIFKRNFWSELQNNPSADDVKSWRESRSLDGFSSNLLLSEALRRVAYGKSYPPEWIAYAAKGLQVGYYNSAPLLNAVLLYRLAIQENKRAEALAAIEYVERFSLRTPVVSFETYGTLLDLAKSCAADGISTKKVASIIEGKLSQATTGLNPYEKMLVYPQMAAAFVALGYSEKAVPLRKEVLAIIENDVDPETKGVGLTRLWLSYAVAGDEPEKKVLSRMDEQARRIGMEISTKK